MSFELASTIFQDPFTIERLDDGEERFIVIGVAERGLVLFVAFTVREECIRIISTRRALQNEQEDYFRQNA